MKTVSKNTQTGPQKTVRKISAKTVMSALFALTLFVFWYLVCPHLLSFHEQNQLFLFDWNYIFHGLIIGGGLADLAGEFLVQFFVFPAAGALIMSLLFTGLQLALSRLFKNYAFSFAAPLLIIIWMGDMNAMVNFPVALLAAALLCPLFEKSGWWNIILFPLAFWLLGPLGAVPMVFALIRKHSVKESVSFLVGAALCYASYRLFLSQFPAREVFCGINYYRGKDALPGLQIAAMLTVPVLFIADVLLPKVFQKTLPQILCMVVFVAGTLVGMHFTYSKDVHTLLKFDCGIRYGRYDKVLKTAHKYQPKLSSGCTAVNLALYMTGRIDKDLDKYFQTGTEGLIMPSIRDNLSDIATGEVFWCVGLPNQALQYSFDLQESIPNCRKSGRFTCRIAQCHILDGHYEIASKYLDVLSKSLFYKSWAKEHKKLLWNEDAIAKHPVYSVLREFRMDEDIIPDRNNFEYIFASLFKKNEKNMMAAQYFKAWKRLQIIDQMSENE